MRDGEESEEAEAAVRRLEAMVMSKEEVVDSLAGPSILIPFRHTHPEPSSWRSWPSSGEAGPQILGCGGKRSTAPISLPGRRSGVVNLSPILRRDRQSPGAPALGLSPRASEPVVFLAPAARHCQLLDGKGRSGGRNGRFFAMSASMVAASKFAGEVRINEAHIGTAGLRLMGSPHLPPSHRTSIR